MGFMDWLFGKSRPGETDKRKEMLEPVAIAPGRSFTFDVVGEAHYQEALDRIVGGKCEEGCDLEVTAQLVFDEGNEHDSNAVGILIDRMVVGYVPREKAAEIRSEILRINPEQRPVTCNAKIVGGWDRGRGDSGHYGVKLSISKPMRLKP